MSEPRKYVLEFPSNYKLTARQHPAYGQWAMMLTRCRNPRFKKFPDYGGRGIKVCERWQVGEHGMTGFECFMHDMGNKPSERHSLDRINNDGDYEPENCRWATDAEQANNRRSNRKLTYRGETMSMMDLATKVGMSYFVLRNRIRRGWSVEDAVEKPKWFFEFRPIARGQTLSKKLTDKKVMEIRELYATGGHTMESIGIRFGIGAPNVCLIVNRKTWAHVP